MAFKFILYFVVTILVIWTMDTININQIFKKNANPIQAKLFYFFVGLSLIYLVTNFFYDLITSVKIL
jgi:uncharacterized membrane protein YwzB